MAKQTVLDSVWYPMLRHTLCVRASRWFGVQCYRALKWHTGKKLRKHMDRESPVVLSGPFEGMRYPDWKSVGSELEPKIIGTYENELHGILEQVFHADYPLLVDIGAAEGYYAVGISRKLQNTRCVAFERTESGRSLCRKMAEINGVAARVSVLGNCDLDGLSKCLGDTRALVVCDCEGYEYDLLDTRKIPKLADCDLLVELHIVEEDANASEFEKIKMMFKETHDITFVNLRKKNTLPPQVFLGKLNRYEKEVMLDENRSQNAGWVFLKSNQH